jgi:hypothetical protein
VPRTLLSFPFIIPKTTLCPPAHVYLRCLFPVLTFSEPSHKTRIITVCFCIKTDRK